LTPAKKTKGVVLPRPAAIRRGALADAVAPAERQRAEWFKGQSGGLRQWAELPAFELASADLGIDDSRLARGVHKHDLPADPRVRER